MPRKKVHRQAPTHPKGKLTISGHMAPASSPRVTVLRARFDYTPQHSAPVRSGIKFLSFKAGDKFTLIQKADMNWWVVKAATGDVGCVPNNYMDPVPTVTASSHEPVVASMYVSVRTFTAPNDGELSCFQDEVLDLIEKRDGNWWSMRNAEGQVGLVPARYLVLPAVAAVYSESWYHGPISRERAEAVLKRRPGPGFLVRESRVRRGHFSLSLISSSAMTGHTKLEKIAGGYAVHAATDDFKSPTICDLVTHYRHYPISRKFGVLGNPCLVEGTEREAMHAMMSCMYS